MFMDYPTGSGDEKPSEYRGQGGRQPRAIDYRGAVDRGSRTGWPYDWLVAGESRFQF